MGKGDKPRPVNRKRYKANFDLIFGKKKSWWETDEHKKWVEEAKKIKDESQSRE